jgi:hypothetical protein
MSSSPDLRERQRSVIFDMIAQATAPASSGNADVPWKVLVFDAVGRDILAPVVKVKELRDAGVTLHLSLADKRQAMPGVPAIYFCEPTAENVALIAEDCANEVYSYVYLNFVSQIGRELLEAFAEQLVSLPSIHHLRVFDRSLNYIALANDCFALTLDNTFFAMNSRLTTDAAMERKLNEMAVGLSHVYLSAQTLPIVAYAKSGPAQEVAMRTATALNDLVREQLLPSASIAAQRPLLLIVDRSYDVASALHHPFTYRGLVSDALGMKLNKVDVVIDGQAKSFELDPDHDQFWRDHALDDFSAIGDHVDAALASYKKEYAALSAAEGVSSAEANAADTVTRMLAQAPRLAERKRSIDTHASIAMAALTAIHKNQLDAFHGVERGILLRESFDKEQFVKLLSDGAALDDKDRLYLLAYLAASEADQATFVEGNLAAALGGRPSLPALAFLKSLKAWSVPGGAAGGDGDDAGWGINKVAQMNFRNLTKAFTAADTRLPLTRLVDALSGDAAAAGHGKEQAKKLLDEVAAVDPKSKEPVAVGSVGFDSLCVFVVGGGSVVEYDDLKAWEAAGGARRAVTYGCTEMLSGAAFLAQLNQLGAESAPAAAAAAPGAK